MRVSCHAPRGKRSWGGARSRTGWAPSRRLAAAGAPRRSCQDQWVVRAPSRARARPLLQSARTAPRPLDRRQLALRGPLWWSVVVVCSSKPAASSSLRERHTRSRLAHTTTRARPASPPSAALTGEDQRRGGADKAEERRRVIAARLLQQPGRVHLVSPRSKQREIGEVWRGTRLCFGRLLEEAAIGVVLMVWTRAAGSRLSIAHAERGGVFARPSVCVRAPSPQRARACARDKASF